MSSYFGAANPELENQHHDDVGTHAGKKMKKQWKAKTSLAFYTFVDERLPQHETISASSFILDIVSSHRVDQILKIYGRLYTTKNICDFGEKKILVKTKALKI